MDSVCSFVMKCFVMLTISQNTNDIKEQNQARHMTLSLCENIYIRSYMVDYFLLNKTNIQKKEREKT